MHGAGTYPPARRPYAPRVATEGQGDELLGGLDEAQRAAVTSAAGPLCVHAGAGSGKTRVLTRRIAHRAATGDLDPRHALALTFTRKAAGELRARLRELGLRDDVAAGTFHAIAYAQLRARWADRGAEVPRLMDRKLRFVADLLGRRRDAAQDVVSEIEWASARLISPSDYLDRAARAGRRPPLPGDEMPHLLDRYAEAKTESRLVDFDDLLRLALRIMERDAPAAAAQRWRFRHLFVDEFQDVNPLQYRLLRAWLGDADDLFVVGDPHQAIYGWNGADARYLDRFEEAFPAERHPGVAVLHLRDNYRSTPQVLATAAAVLATTRLVAHRPDGPMPTVVAHADEAAEARAITRDVRERHGPGRPWSTQAVLVRTNAQGAVITEALSRAGIPHRLRGADQLLGRPGVVDVLRRLRREPYAAVLADLRSPPSDVGTEATALAAEDADQAAEDRATLVILAREYEALDPEPSGPAFASWLVAAVRSGEGADKDVVEVSTLHAAKGLEWPVVHLAGLEDGLVPIGYAKTPAARAEEQRLLYVGVTRAQDEVRLHWSRTRVQGGEARERSPSPWLPPVEAAITDLLVAARPVDGRHHLEAPRAELHARHPDPVEGVDEVLTRLAAWRAQTARVARVAPQAVVDDRTLHAIAEAHPTSVEALTGLPGLGPIKAARFGDGILAALDPS